MNDTTISAPVPFASRRFDESYQKIDIRGSADVLVGLLHRPVGLADLGKKLALPEGQVFDADLDLAKTDEAY